MKRLLMIIIFLSGLTLAQELDATVTVNMESLPISERDKLIGFEQTMSDYLNNTKFGDGAWNYDKIQCSFNVFFTSGANFEYKAQVVIRSMRQVYESTKKSPILVVNDPSWLFSYETNQSTYYDPDTFTPFESFLNFYAYIIIAMENESWDSFQGTSFTGTNEFNKAFNTTRLYIPSSYQPGWTTETGVFTRAGLIENIIDGKYAPFRAATSDFQMGIDVYDQAPEDAQILMVQFIFKLQELGTKIDFRSPYIRAFFDAKSGEIVDYLASYPDRNIWNILKRVDPPNFSKYDAML